MESYRLSPTLSIATVRSNLTFVNTLMPWYWLLFSNLPNVGNFSHEASRIEETKDVYAKFILGYRLQMPVRTPSCNLPAAAAVTADRQICRLQGVHSDVPNDERASRHNKLRRKLRKPIAYTSRVDVSVSCRLGLHFGWFLITVRYPVFWQKHLIFATSKMHFRFGLHPPTFCSSF